MLGVAAALPFPFGDSFNLCFLLYGSCGISVGGEGSGGVLLVNVGGSGVVDISWHYFLLNFLLMYDG